MSSIYDQLAAIASANHGAGYLVAYAADLHTHDKRTLSEAKAGARFVFVLRPHGTELFAVASGRDPVWCTFWLTGGMGHMSDAPSLCFLVKVANDGAADGTVRSISQDAARKLAAIPHPQGLKARRVSLFADGSVQV
jgi:hypothetical protein